MSLIGDTARKPAISQRLKRPVFRAIPLDSDSSVDAPRDMPFRMPRMHVPVFPPNIVDIRDHGALPAGSDCTNAIADAIRHCAALGGGRVLIPRGQWLSGAIHLKSNIELHLEQGAILRFSSNPSQYLPCVFVRWSGIECYNYSPFIYARDCRNIAITGKGRLLGQGQNWWNLRAAENRAHAQLHAMTLNGVAVEKRRFGRDEAPLRPQFILPINCTNVLLEDFTIAEGGAFWTIHIAYCRNVVVRRLRVDAPHGPNNDGIVIDSSRNIVVEDCELRTREDCISLKSGMNEDGWRVGRRTENVIIRRIRAIRGEGGFTIGSDMSGGVRNVFVHDCHHEGLSAGIRMKAARGRGGVVERVVIQNITMDKIPGDAIHLTTEYPSFARSDGKAPTFRNIVIRNVTCREAKSAARMIGLHDSALRNIRLENITINADEGLYCASASDVRLTNVNITPRTGPVLSVRNAQDVRIQGLHNTNRNSVFLDVRGRQTRNIRLCGETSPAARPAVVLGIDVPRDALVHE